MRPLSTPPTSNLSRHDTRTNQHHARYPHHLDRYAARFCLNAFRKYDDIAFGKIRQGGQGL